MGGSLSGLQTINQRLMLALAAVALVVALAGLVCVLAQLAPRALADVRRRRERRRYVRAGIRELELYLTRAPGPRRRQP